MKKYLSIFKISFQQEFAYKLNFIMWRLRNVFQILIFFFLWDAAFSGPQKEIFGYTRDKILTYAFVLVIIRAIVLSSRSVDVASQIANGELSNILLKPMHYFKYWVTRDLSSKALNVIFAFFEIFVLLLILKPPIFLQTNILYLLLFIISLIISGFIFFNILMLTNFVPFWAPEVAWGAQFLVVVVVVEFLSGSFFPIDVFPAPIYNFLKLTPFPYLIFAPIKIYLGNFSLAQSLQSVLIGGLWCFILWLFMNSVWKKGLKVYEAVGR